MNEPILVLGQNPGEIGDGDSNRKWWVNHFKRMAPLPEGMLSWYEWDFLTSRGYRELEKILGNGWLYTGKFAYSNAVRCRTFKNAKPSEEMQQSCKIYTRQLLYGRVALVLMGVVAVRQIMGDTEFQWGKLIKSKSGVIILPIKHYVTWGEKTVGVYSKIVEKLIKEIGA